MNTSQLDRSGAAVPPTECDPFPNNNKTHQTVRLSMIHHVNARYRSAMSIRTDNSLQQNLTQRTTRSDKCINN